MKGWCGMRRWLGSLMSVFVVLTILLMCVCARDPATHSGPFLQINRDMLFAAPATDVWSNENEAEQNEKQQQKQQQQEGALDPANSLATGQGTSIAIVDSENFINLQMRDAEGNPVSETAYNISGYLGNQPTVLFSSVLLSRGLYQLKYRPYQVGATQLLLFVNGVELQQSPFAVDVIKSTLVARNTVVEGSGLHNATCGQAASFTISLRDQYNHTIDASARLLVAVQQRVCSHCSPTQLLTLKTQQLALGRGLYLVTYTPELPVPTSVQVRVDKRLLAPHQVAVQPGATVAATSTAFGNGIHRSVVRERNVFYIQARDAFSNPVRGSHDTFVVQIYSDNVTVTPHVAPQGHGLYLVSYKPHSHGSHFRVNVALQDSTTGTLTLIHGAPFHLVIEERIGYDLLLYGSIFSVLSFVTAILLLLFCSARFGRRHS